MDTASSSDPASSAGYGAGQPHESISQFHDRESFVAAIAATFGASETASAPVDQDWSKPGDVASEIATMLEARQDGEASAACAAGGGSPPPLLDLIEEHNSNETPTPTTPRVIIKTQCYPAGPRRVVIRQLRNDRDPMWECGLKSNGKREKAAQERQDSSVKRTRKIIQMRCMSFKADRLLTLTYRENMTDRDRAYRDSVKFIQRCRAANLLPKYVAVPEQQKRGAWHVHIACRGFMSVLTLRRIWRSIVGRDNGNIDLSYRNRGQSNPWRIAAYLGKYIGKAIEQSAPGDRTFWASEWGGQEPVDRVTLLPAGVTLTQVKVIVLRLLDQMRQNGGIEVIDEWAPRRNGSDPPDTFVFWAA